MDKGLKDSSLLSVHIQDQPNGTFDELPAMEMASPSNDSETANTNSEANIPSSGGTDETHRVQIDTTAPFESVKQAVSKFGGIVDWNVHRAQTAERGKFIDQELGKLAEEIPLLKKQYEDAEEAKTRVLEDLGNTKRAAEELKLNLERSHTEEQQARQDSELARLRAEEIEQGIADEASVAARAQLEVAKSRREAAVSETKTLRAEFEKLCADYSDLVCERDEAVKRAEEAVSASKEIEKTAEDLTVQAIALKEALQHRLGAEMAREENILSWEKQVRESEEEVDKVKQQIESAKDLKQSLDSASALLLDLKSQFSTYLDSKLPENESSKKELEEMKHIIEKETAEVNILRVEVGSLRAELEREKSEALAVQQREGMASIAVSSLETELERTASEVSLAQSKEREARERLTQLPKQLQEAAKEAEMAKSVLEMARMELRKEKEEVEQAKAKSRTTQRRLLAAQKEAEAARASSERLALKESQSDGQDSPSLITLSLNEYYELSKKAHEAEEEANRKISAALSQVEVAKECEAKTLKKLEEVNSEMRERKEALSVALEKAEMAKQGKLAMEQELRRWRAEHEQRRKANEPVPMNRTISPLISFSERKEPKVEDDDTSSPMSPDKNKNINATTQEGKKKKKPFFPRFLMFLSKKKVQSKMG